MADKPISTCCEGRVESFYMPTGKTYYWCRTCKIPLHEDGSDARTESRWDYQYHPIQDFTLGIHLIEEYSKFLGKRLEATFSVKEWVESQRSAFEMGASFVAHNPDATPEVIKERAEIFYPFPKER